MRMLGLIGGMSWESTALYYRLINEGVRDALGPTSSAPCLVWSFDFAEIEQFQHAGDWSTLGTMLAEAARRLEAAGAEHLVLCTNTMHCLAAAIESSASAPLLHIADPTADAIRSAGHRRVGLLGTAFTMEQDFYRQRLAARAGVEVLVPDAADRAEIHRIIYTELVAGRIEPASRAIYRQVVARLAEAGAEGVVLGCTEIGLLLGGQDSAVPLYDTTVLHAQAAVRLVLAG